MTSELLRSWADEVEALCARCDGAVANASGEIVLEMFSLCQAGPAEFCGQWKGLSRSEIVSLVECDATESAAIRLLKPHGYMLSVGSQFAVATVAFPEVGEVSALGDCEAIAVCGAIATALSQMVRLKTR